MNDARVEVAVWALAALILGSVLLGALVAHASFRRGYAESEREHAHAPDRPPAHRRSPRRARWWGRFIPPWRKAA